MFSANKIHDHQMKDDTGKDEVGKCSLWANADEVRLVLRVRLDAETDCKKQNKKVGNGHQTKHG